MALWSLAAIAPVAVRWIDPPINAVHIQRRFQAWIHLKPYQERYRFIPLSEISPNLEHAVIAAEDARFDVASCSANQNLYSKSTTELPALYLQFPINTNGAQ